MSEPNEFGWFSNTRAVNEWPVPPRNEWGLWSNTGPSESDNGDGELSPDPDNPPPSEFVLTSAVQYPLQVPPAIQTVARNISYTRAGYILPGTSTFISLANVVLFRWATNQRLASNGPFHLSISTVRDTFTFSTMNWEMRGLELEPWAGMAIDFQYFDPATGETYRVPNVVHLAP